MDPIDDAKAQMKKHAARALARKEEIEAQLEPLRAQRTQLAEDRARAESAGAPELVAEIDDVLTTLDQRIESMEGQAAIFANTVDDVLKEMGDLEGSRSQLERDTLMGKVRALTSSDPFSMDPAARALANVRDHAAQMDAELELEDHLSPESERALREIEKKEKEDGVRTQLAALKAAKKAEAEAAAEAEETAKDPTKKPKRTL